MSAALTCIGPLHVRREMDSVPVKPVPPGTGDAAGDATIKLAKLRERLLKVSRSPPGWRSGLGTSCWMVKTWAAFSL